MMDNKMINPNAEAFWEDLYNRTSQQTSGRPSQILFDYVDGRAPGNALDLGCARGDDTVWLAKQGWQVTGVDISTSALEIAAQNAARNDVSAQIRFEQHDLAYSLPVGEFDLVTAIFLQTPLDFPRAEVLSRAAAQLRKDGLLIITSHQKVAPWSWGDPNVEYPNAQERLGELGLKAENWLEIFIGSIERVATNKSGEKAEVADAVIVMKRL